MIMANGRLLWISTFLLASNYVLQLNGVLSFSTGLPFSKTQRADAQDFSFSTLIANRRGTARYVHNSGATEGPWKLSNDFNIFLNQCSIQSFIYLVNSLRDRHTALWLEEFTQPIIQSHTVNEKRNDDKVLSSMAKALVDNMPDHVEQDIKLLNYHGLGALNATLFPTWDSYFDKLLEEPTFTYLIESTRAHVPTYELEINPTSLCTRIISVREQIAREFAKDLDVIADMSEKGLETYFAKRKGDADPEKVDVNQANLVFLMLGVGPDLQASSEYKPSPLRTGNFDLLMLLVTQESIHRVLNDSSSSSSSDKEHIAVLDESSVQFLRNFYSQRLGTHFIGSNWYGRADDFLEELLATPPSVVQLRDEECGRVDPIAIVRSILKEREEVALEWLELALDVPQSHGSIKRRQLDKLMGRDTSMSEDSSFQ